MEFGQINFMIRLIKIKVLTKPERKKKNPVDSDIYMLRISLSIQVVIHVYIIKEVCDERTTSRHSYG